MVAEVFSGMIQGIEGNHNRPEALLAPMLAFPA